MHPRSSTPPPATMTAPKYPGCTDRKVLHSFSRRSQTKNEHVLLEERRAGVSSMSMLVFCVAAEITATKAAITRFTNNIGTPGVIVFIFSHTHLYCAFKLVNPVQKLLLHPLVLACHVPGDIKGPYAPGQTIHRYAPKTRSCREKGSRLRGVQEARNPYPKPEGTLILYVHPI